MCVERNTDNNANVDMMVLIDTFSRSSRTNLLMDIRMNMKRRRKLRWDSAKRREENRSAAQRLVSCQHRSSFIAANIPPSRSLKHVAAPTERLQLSLAIPTAAHSFLETYDFIILIDPDV